MSRLSSLNSFKGYSYFGGSKYHHDATNQHSFASIPALSRPDSPMTSEIN